MTPLNRTSDQTWILTGASGIVGSSLRAAIAPKVASLRLVDIKEITNLNEQEEAIILDINDFGGLVEAFRGAYGIIHLAGLADEADFHDLMRDNVAGTYNVFEAARRTGVKRIIYASSNRATGFYSVDSMVHPSMPPRPDGLYGATKVASEAIARLYADKFGLEVVVVRIGSFEEKPMDARQLSTWLSPGDCQSAFLAAMNAVDVTYSTIYAVSRNKRRWWDIEPGLRLGFEPKDDAEEYAEGIEKNSDAIEPSLVQGGMFASKDYTLSRQRPI
ncbi:NAD dependent epimerase/dehydratase family protein [Sarocladium implicatum]|nr:NAD dependent epimerase/dehydratase family protein [Sarocladium implicatum]